MLDLVAKLAQSDVRARAEEFLAGNPGSGPAIVELDPTSYCDLACPTCVTSDVLNDGRIGSEHFEKLVADIIALRVLGVILIGGGEPLLHPRTPWLVTALSDAGIRIGVVTNGTQLPRLRETLRHRTSWVRVSVDAATPAMYQSLRPSRSGRNSFDLVISGIRALTAVSRSCSVGYSFVVHERAGDSPGNISDIAKAAELASDIGCDYVEFKGEMDEQHRLMPLSEDAREGIREQLESANSLITKNFRVIPSSSLTAQLSGEPRSGQEKRYGQCPVSSLRTLVTPAGVYVCSYHRGNPKARYAGTDASTLLEGWANRSAEIDPRRDCGFHCARHEINEVLLSGQLPPEREGDTDVFL